MLTIVDHGSNLPFTIANQAATMVQPRLTMVDHGRTMVTTWFIFNRVSMTIRGGLAFYIIAVIPRGCWAISMDE